MSLYHETQLQALPQSLHEFNGESRFD